MQTRHLNVKSPEVEQSIEVKDFSKWLDQVSSNTTTPQMVAFEFTSMSRFGQSGFGTYKY